MLREPEGSLRSGPSAPRRCRHRLSGSERGLCMESVWIHQAQSLETNGLFKARLCGCRLPRLAKVRLPHPARASSCRANPSVPSARRGVLTCVGAHHTAWMSCLRETRTLQQRQMCFRPIASMLVSLSFGLPSRWFSIFIVFDRRQRPVAGVLQRIGGALCRCHSDHHIQCIA